MANRITWVDTAKALGMILVFYGHYVERISVEANSAHAFWQIKLIYSFHMPLFFFIAGFFAKKRPISQAAFRKLFLSRLLPVITFCLLCIPFWIYHYAQIEGAKILPTIAEKGLLLIRGNPQLNYICWFLVCLFTVETLAMLGQFPKASLRNNLIAGILFLVLGHWMCSHMTHFIYYLGLDKNTWYIHEAVVAMGFYLIGGVLFPVVEKLRNNRKGIFAFLFPLMGILWVAANIWSPSDLKVLMADAAHGPLLPFLACAFTGVGMLISLSILLPANRLLSFLGRHTLILLGLNGFFHHFFNLPTFQLFTYQDSWQWVIGNCLLITTLSLLACLPFTYLLDRFFPQLMGKPSEKGPILPRLDGFSLRKGVKDTL